MENRYFIVEPLNFLVPLVKRRLNDTITFADGKLSVSYNSNRGRFIATFIQPQHRRYRYTEHCPQVTDALIVDTLAFFQCRIFRPVKSLPELPLKELNTIVPDNGHQPIIEPAQVSSIKVAAPEITEKPISANTLVWVQLNKSKQLALVVSGRLHAVVVRMYLKNDNRFSLQKETVTLRVVQRAELSSEEMWQTACGKHILSKNKALQLVAVNFVFTDVERRKERRVYYCTRCRGFHTTSMRWLPKAIRDKLRLHPFPAYLERTGKSINGSETLHQWLREDIGLKIGHRIFVKTLHDFEPDYQRAMQILLRTPGKYIEYVLYEFFHYRNDHNDQLLEP